MTVTFSFYDIHSGNIEILTDIQFSFKYNAWCTGTEKSTIFLLVTISFTFWLVLSLNFKNPEAASIKFSAWLGDSKFCVVSQIIILILCLTEMYCELFDYRHIVKEERQSFISAGIESKISHLNILIYVQYIWNILDVYLRTDKN